MILKDIFIQGENLLEQYTDIDNLIQSLKSKNVVIYGAGRTTKKLKNLLMNYGVGIYAIWDKGANEIKKIEAIPIEEPQYSIIHKNGNEFVFICNAATERTVKSIVKTLKKELGIGCIIVDGLKLMSVLSVDECLAKLKNEDEIDLRECSRCIGIFEKCLAFKTIIKSKVVLDTNSTEFIEMENIGVEITSKCSLKCEKCMQLIPLYLKGKDVLFDLLIEDLEKIAESVDLIYLLNLVGGELFLHKQYKDIIKQLLNIKNIGMLCIATNGTVVIDDETYDLLSNKRIIVNVSGYGEHIPSKLKGNLETFLLKLQEHNVFYNYNSSMAWFDFGNFDFRNKKEDEVKKDFLYCNSKCNVLLDGKLFHCDRNAHGVRLGIIPDNKSDYCEVRDNSKNNLKSDLKIFLNQKHINACNYCDSPMNAMPIESGKQVK